MNNDLIYYINLIDSCCCFCILKSLEKEIFQMTHNKHHHVSFHWIYDTIVASLFIQSLSQQLSQYIIHCLQCQHYQIIQHQSYKILQSVVRSLISFHTVMTDFIVELLKTKDEFDAVMTVICKFLKKIKFILSKETWIITQWAKTYFAVTTDWNILLIWIDNRNFKWLSVGRNA